MFKLYHVIKFGMKVSVVIPAYNEEKYLPTCLNALSIQEVNPDEIIVIDNNSTDSTAKVAQQFKVNLIQEKIQGLIYARNRGFTESKYEIIARCDADTIVPADWIKKIKQNFLNNEIDALFGPIYYYDLLIKTASFCQLYIFLMNLIQGHHVLIGPNMVISKIIWNKIKNHVCINDSLVHEDIDLAYHINQLSGKIKYDAGMIAATSARRIKGNLFSFFGEYPWRLFKTLQTHKPSVGFT